jgi:cytochrome c biogenesis protein CcmG/thiol:disulfide interchange protein DsbE
MSEASKSTEGQSASEGRQSSGIKRVLLIPLGVFLLLVVILALGFRLDDPHLLPSVLINRPFPEFQLPELHDPERTVTVEDLKGEVALVNVWATWCANCLVEHPELMRIAHEEGVPIYGINYNDDPVKARQWLQRHGDAYRLIMVDQDGKLGIDLGIYGAPETFLIDANGVIQFKQVGIVTPELWRQTLKPLIAQLREGTS